MSNSIIDNQKDIGLLNGVSVDCVVIPYEGNLSYLRISGFGFLQNNGILQNTRNGERYCIYSCDRTKMDGEGVISILCGNKPDIMLGDYLLRT